MKKLIPACLLFLLLCACGTTQMRQEPTIFMNSQAKINYYQEQINRYQVLIDLERKKIEAEKIKN